MDLWKVTGKADLDQASQLRQEMFSKQIIISLVLPQELEAGLFHAVQQQVPDTSKMRCSEMRFYEYQWNLH